MNDVAAMVFAALVAEQARSERTHNHERSFDQTRQDRLRRLAGEAIFAAEVFANTLEVQDQQRARLKFSGMLTGDLTDDELRALRKGEEERLRCLDAKERERDSRGG